MDITSIWPYIAISIGFSLGLLILLVPLKNIRTPLGGVVPSKWEVLGCIIAGPLLGALTWVLGIVFNWSLTTLGIR